MIKADFEVSDILPFFAAAGSVLCNLTVFHANAACSKLLSPAASTPLSPRQVYMHALAEPSSKARLYKVLRRECIPGVIVVMHSLEPHQLMG